MHLPWGSEAQSEPSTSGGSSQKMISPIEGEHEVLQGAQSRVPASPGQRQLHGSRSRAQAVWLSKSATDATTWFTYSYPQLRPLPDQGPQPVSPAAFFKCLLQRRKGPGGNLWVLPLGSEIHQKPSRAFLDGWGLAFQRGHPGLEFRVQLPTSVKENFVLRLPCTVC